MATSQDPASTPRNRRLTRRISPYQLVALLLAFVLVAGAGGILAAGFAIPVAAGVHTTAVHTRAVLDDVPTELQRRALSQASTVYAANGEHLATFYAQNRIVVPLDQISQYMIDAVVAIEDERFFEHSGIDVRGMVRAFVNNLQDGPTQGASTITQQYVKNVLIDAAYHADDRFGVIEARDQSMARKAREAQLAMALEQQMTKEEILQGYLNLAQFGRQNIFGVETAARFFFNKPASDLTPVEAATIAGITNAPSRFDPTVNPRLSEQRRNLVLHRMWTLGKLTTEQWEEARATPVEDTLDITPVPTGCQAAGDAAFFCDYVINVIRTSPEFGETEAERLDLLHRGGLRIHTTLDMDLQAAAAEEVASHVPGGNTAGLEAAIAAVEPGTGKILAMAQNTPFDASRNPAPGTTAINFSAGPSHGASRGFQPGSTFKPFQLADWLLAGRTLNETVNANRVSRPQSAWNASCTRFGGPSWSPRNVEGNLGGRISVQRAMSDSVNTAFTDMSTQVDLCTLRDTAWDMGFRPTTRPGPGGTVVTLFDPTPDDVLITPAMILGTQTTSPLQLAAAYATLASNGTYCDPVAITRVIGADGRDLAVPRASCTPDALPANVAATVTYSLQNVMTDGTGRRSQLSGGRVSAGKTGTNQGSSQTWFVGFTPQLSTAAWVGEASGETTNFNITFNGRFIRTLFGSTLAAPMWADFMDRAHADLPQLAFPAPDPALVGTPAPRVTDDRTTDRVDQPTSPPADPQDAPQVSPPPAPAPTPTPPAVDPVPDPGPGAGPGAGAGEGDGDD
ncbi:transglycosylase domain-containing protein [Xylanimonas protaetiae]|uniref:Penicillin-binding protein n=1 Tax=Xylanimonas protaetiae TaxID=2509457 RepID=A0A4P6F8W6_9MICO|nr:transglycosylase domain-containing protein [Xylanimonas protaetiae]QAY70779.1 penicillin-binding protein [Xylanimonas protaetiae]